MSANKPSKRVSLMLAGFAYLEGLLNLNANILNSQQEEGNNAAHQRSEPFTNCPQPQGHKGQPYHQKLRSVPAGTVTCVLQLLTTSQGKCDDGYRHDSNVLIPQTCSRQ